MKEFFKIFTIFNSKEQRYCGFVVLCMVIGAILEAIGIGAILPLISIMSDEDYLNKHLIIKRYLEYFNINNHISFVLVLVILMICIYIVKNIYISWLNKIQINFSTKNQKFYAKELLAEYINKPYVYHLSRNTATLLRNVSNGSINIFSGMLISIFTLLTELITAFTVWLMLVLIDAFTAVIVAGTLAVIMFFILKYFRDKIIKQGEIQNKYAEQYMKWLNQGLGSIKETKVLNKEEFFLGKFEKSYNEYANANAYFNFVNQLPRLIIETVVVIGILLLITIKLILGVKPIEIVPLLGVLSLAAFRLMPCANRIINLLNSIKFQSPLFNELYDDLISIKRHKYNSNNKKCNKEKLSFNNNIMVKNVSFSYPENGEKVLDKVSFVIPKGYFVGVIGKSGAGKTTFVDIILGLLKVSEGEVIVDGINISDNIKIWQANLAYVPQSIYLIDGSIKENIALGVSEEEIDDLKITNALKMAELYSFIQELPNNINTHVGERGVKLSGGQRQRIGIARALYHDPEVLILDEATSALDNDTEKSITNTILKLKGKITIIAIAHRITTLKKCDFLIEFKNGKVNKIIKDGDM